MEEIPRVPRLSPNDQECLKHFKETSFRNEEGCYVVRLPFSGTPQFTGIHATARICMNRLKRRFRQTTRRRSRVFRLYARVHRPRPYRSCQGERGRIKSIVLPATSSCLQTGRGQNPIRLQAGSQKDARGVSLNSLLHGGPK